MLLTTRQKWGFNTNTKVLLIGESGAHVLSPVSHVFCLPFLPPLLQPPAVNTCLPSYATPSPAPRCPVPACEPACGQAVRPFVAWTRWDGWRLLTLSPTTLSPTPHRDQPQAHPPRAPWGHCPQYWPARWHSLGLAFPPSLFHFSEFPAPAPWNHLPKSATCKPCLAFWGFQSKLTEDAVLTPAHSDAAHPFSSGPPLVMCAHVHFTHF